MEQGITIHAPHFRSEILWEGVGEKWFRLGTWKLNKDFMLDDRSGGRSAECDGVFDWICFIQRKNFGPFNLYKEMRPLLVLHQIDLGQRRFGTDLSGLCSSAGFLSLQADYTPSERSDDDNPPVGVSHPLGPFEGCVPPLRNAIGLGFVVTGLGLALFSIRRMKGWLLLFSWLWIWTGILIALTGHHPCRQEHSKHHPMFSHDEPQPITNYGVSRDYNWHAVQL
jgi:hypothetical protein